jgi:hypothetical protein
VSDAEIEQLGKGSSDGGETDASTHSPYRKPALALARAVVVLAIVAVGYVEIAPINHSAVHHPAVTKPVRSRLANLTLKTSGVAGYKAKPASAGELPAANAGIAAYTAASKKSPNQSGIYSVYWTSTAKGSTSQVGVVAFLLPTPADAASVLKGLNTSEMGAKAQSGSSLKRASTFTVPGVAGSEGSVFEPSKATKTPAFLVLAVFRQGDVIGFINSVESGSTPAESATAQANAVTMAKAESKHLTAVEPGFTLLDVTKKAYVTPASTHYPQVATIVWIVGGVAAALVAGAGPLLVGRARQRRRERLQAELNRLIVVRGQTITKYRR